MKMKKGQVIGQPLVYVFAIIVIALILFFGFKMVGNLIDFEKDVDYADFLNNFDNDINIVYSESFGSTKSLESLRIPDEITEICFVVINEDYVEGMEPTDEKMILYLNERFGSPEENVFFGGKYEGRTFEKLSIEQDFCVFDFESVFLEKQANNVKIFKQQM
jgi:hypothetical protein